jgi:hypothetical protein
MYETIAEFREAMRELGDNLDLLIGTNVRFYIKANPNDGADGIFMNGRIIAVPPGQGPIVPDHGYVEQEIDSPREIMRDVNFRIRVRNQNDKNKLSQDLQNEND